MMEVGKKYYIKQHAYYHVIGEVLEINPGEIVLKNVIQVHSSDRNWTDFFRLGIGKGTKYDVLPDGHGVRSMIDYTPWHHDIPTERK